MDLLLGIDIGTTGAKTVLIDEVGKTIAHATSEWPLSTPHPNWAEQNPDDWWKGTVASIREVLSLGHLKDSDVIRGIGLSGQMHSSVFLDKDNKVLRPAMLWCDARTAPQCKWITEKVGSENLRKWVYNPALEGFTAPKIIWVRDNEPKVFEKVRRVLLPKDYIRFLMTGEQATEVSDAAGTLMFDVKNRRWSEEFLKATGISRDFLPPVFESTDVCGVVTSAFAGLTGLKAGTPVVGGGADNTCGATGTGIVKEGRVLASLGTSGVIFAHTDEVKSDPRMRVHTFCHSVPWKWYLMGVTLSAGGAFRWYRDTFADEEKKEATKQNRDVYDLLTAEAETVPPGSEGLFFLPYLMGERTPHQSANARAAFIGFSTRHNRTHCVRAVLEGITFGMRDSLEIMRELGLKVQEIRLTGGGGKSLFWRHLQADIYGAEVVTVNNTEGPAFGAAIMAGVGVGVYQDIIEGVEQLVTVVEHIQPRIEAVERYNDYYELFRELYPALKDSYDRISLQK
jgi:xylulokinase